MRREATQEVLNRQKVNVPVHLVALSHSRVFGPVGILTVWLASGRLYRDAETNKDTSFGMV